MNEDNKKNSCWINVLGYSGAAFLALAASSDNLEKHLVMSGSFWILGGTFIAFCWAYEKFCIGNGG